MAKQASLDYPIVDWLKGSDLAETMVEAGAAKASLSSVNIFLRGMLGGAFLAIATSISFYAAAQTGLPIVGALLFPVGFMMINILGVDLITGYFAIVTTAFTVGRMSFVQLARCFFFVWLGNLAGSALYAYLLWVSFSMAGHAPDTTGLVAVINKIGLFKTVHYEQFGAAGAITAFTKGMLCNWMVTLGVILPMSSRTVFGKMAITYFPIFAFFALGYEHMVVNMFIMPAAMFFGAPITQADFWIGNELPVTLGNFFGGFIFTGLAIAAIYYTRKSAAEEPSFAVQPAAAR